ncbi:MAG: signal peptidase I, partial [Solirubrobacteraceae bacterium]
MRRPTRLRSGLFTAAFVSLAMVAWLYLAPTQIGGTTSYVVTSGISMEPSFRTGDLALVRPADQYRVGQVVAYHSTLLHVTVLHRIVAHRGGRYFFKGDNNNFID